MDQQQQPWHLTVLRLEGMRLMRPEKSWRPIVTVEIDKHHTHETILGVDGQNINQKEMFSFEQATSFSELKIEVWQRSQSKKKSKKRNLVASSESYCLRELLKRQEYEKKLDIRLKCQGNNKSVSSGGKPQSGALLRVRLRPPAHIVKQHVAESDCEDSSGQLVDLDSTSICSSDPPTTPISPESDQPPITTQTLRRRPMRGYRIDSDDDNDYPDEDDQHFTDSKPTFDDPDCSTCIDEDTFIDTDHSDTGTVIISHKQPSIKSWLAFSLLPVYTEKVEVPPPLTRLERVLASFTMYSELKVANMDSHFEKIFARLQLEWTYVGGLLVALAAVDTAVFSISPGSLFTVDPYAQGAIAASSIASGLGIACDAWFLLRYNWADLHTFIARARDVYGSYFFFSLSARVPSFCMFISAFCLMSFLGLVAFNAWPQGVMVVCFFVGIVMSLQFLVFGAHWCATRVVEGGKASTRGVVRVVRSMTG